MRTHTTSSAGGGQRSSPGTQTPGGRGAAAFTAEFCALGRHGWSRRSIARHTPAHRTWSRPRWRRVPTASPRSSTSSTTPRRSSARWPRGSATRTASSSGAQPRGRGAPGNARTEARRCRRHDLAARVSAAPRCCATTGGAGAPRSPVSPARSRRPVVVIGYHNSIEATLTALERVHSSDVAAGLSSQLRRLRLDLPGGPVTLDRNRQAVRDGYLAKIVVARRQDDARAGGGRPARRADLRRACSRRLRHQAPARSRARRRSPPSWAR